MSCHHAYIEMSARAHIKTHHSRLFASERQVFIESICHRGPVTPRPTKVKSNYPRPFIRTSNIPNNGSGFHLQTQPIITASGRGMRKTSIYLCAGLLLNSLSRRLGAHKKNENIYYHHPWSVQTERNNEWGDLCECGLVAIIKSARVRSAECFNYPRWYNARRTYRLRAHLRYVYPSKINWVLRDIFVSIQVYIVCSRR